jgi:CRP/FNR family transcriptional regulator, cyclic AMP receptor protein
VLSGHLTLQLTVDGRCCPQLLGPGDLLRPEDQRDPGAVLPCEPAWRVVEQADVAVLDGRFTKLLGGHPSAVSALLGRAMRRSRHLAFHLAIAHVPRAEHRMHLLLWHLADRWGHVRTNGVHVPICLTHRLLADLACMQRPTATNALNGLIAAGHASRCRDGSWLLHGEPPAC